MHNSNTDVYFDVEFDADIEDSATNLRKKNFNSICPENLN